MTCSRATRRLAAVSSMCLACWPWLLSAVGIYGLLAYTVSQRAQEIGVRLALGADAPRVGRMIFADGMRLALLGASPARSPPTPQVEP